MYNKLLGYECTWILGITWFSSVIHKMFKFVKGYGEKVGFFFLLVFLVTIHLENRV